MIEDPTYIFLYTDGKSRTASRGKHLFSKNFLKKTADNYSTMSLNNLIPNIALYNAEWSNKSFNCYTLATTDENIALMIELDPTSILNEKSKKTHKYCGSLYVTKESYNIFNTLLNKTKIYKEKLNTILYSIEYKQQQLLTIANTNQWALKDKQLNIFSDRFDYDQISKFKKNIMLKNIDFSEELINKIDKANKHTFDLINELITDLIAKKDDLNASYIKEKEEILIELSHLGFKVE